MRVVICYYSVTLLTTRSVIRAGLISVFEVIFRLVDAWVGSQSFLVPLSCFSSGPHFCLLTRLYGW